MLGMGVLRSNGVQSRIDENDKITKYAFRFLGKYGGNVDSHCMIFYSMTSATREQYAFRHANISRTWLFPQSRHARRYTVSYYGVNIWIPSVGFVLVVIYTKSDW